MAVYRTLWWVTPEWTLHKYWMSKFKICYKGSVEHRATRSNCIWAGEEVARRESSVEEDRVQRVGEEPGNKVGGVSVCKVLAIMAAEDHLRAVGPQVTEHKIGWIYKTVMSHTVSQWKQPVRSPLHQRSNLKNFLSFFSFFTVRWVATVSPESLVWTCFIVWALRLWDLCLPHCVPRG